MSSADPRNVAAAALARRAYSGVAAAQPIGAPGREKDDFYVTPARCTEALLQVEVFPGPIWEPACGDGAISRVLQKAGYDVLSTDLVDRGYGLSRRDFLMEPACDCRSVVTNPPFKLADEFVLHALRLKLDKIAVFMRTAWLEGQARHVRLWKPHPPIRIWQFCARQTLWRGDDPNARTSGGAIAFAWFVWEPEFHGAPTVCWLP